MIKLIAKTVLICIIAHLIEMSKDVTKIDQLFYNNREWII